MPKFVAVNENFFKKWSSEMAYVLGFFTADGCLTVNPRGAHFIEFVSNDRDVLEKIKKAMGSEHKVGKRVKVPNRQQTYRVQIGRKGMFNDLVKLGFTVNKTATVKLPKIPNKYFADYLRGYFDGDGCINYGSYYYKDRKNKKYHIMFRLVCKNRNFLEKLSEHIESLVSTNGKSIFEHTRSSALAYSTKDSLKILKYIYKNSVLHMDRKFRSSNEAIKQYNLIMDR